MSTKRQGRRSLWSGAAAAARKIWSSCDSSGPGSASRLGRMVWRCCISAAAFSAAVGSSAGAAVGDGGVHTMIHI